MSATFRWTWPMSTPGSIGVLTSVPYSLGLLSFAPCTALELEHEAAQERVQLLFLPLAQRSGDQCLLGSLGARRLDPRLLAGLRDLDDDASAVVRIREALDEPGLLQTVQAIRHRTARELGALGELPRRSAERRPRATQDAEHVPLFVAQPMISKRVVMHPFEAACQAAHAVDDALDLQIEVRNVLEPGGLEPTIDVVLFLCFLHGHILSKKSLDVKSLYCYLSTSLTWRYFTSKGDADVSG